MRLQPSKGLLVAAISLLLVLASAPMSSAGVQAEEPTLRPCPRTGIANRTEDGAAASGYETCDPTVDPQPATPRTEKEKWDQHCKTVAGKYEVGYAVDIAPGEQVTGTRVLYDLGFVGQAGTPRLERVTIPTDGVYFEYNISCRTPTGVTVRTVILPQGANPVSPIALRNEVRARIRIPDPSMAGSPPLDDPSRYSFVRIPTWFWLEDPWDPIEDSESRGGISVSVTATPEKVVWDTGDGESETCYDAGIPWRKGLSDDRTDCKHTYTRSSAGEPNDAFRLSATVYWTFSWELDNVPQGDFGTYESVTTQDHQVGEILIVSS